MNKKGVVVILFGIAAAGLVAMHTGQTSERQKKEEVPLASIRVADKQRDISGISVEQVCEKLDIRLSELRQGLLKDGMAGGVTFEPQYIPETCDQDVEKALHLAGQENKGGMPFAAIRVSDNQKGIIEISAKEACDRLELRLSELRRVFWQDRMAGGITFEPRYIPEKCHQDVENALELNVAMK